VIVGFDALTCAWIDTDLARNEAAGWLANPGWAIPGEHPLCDFVTDRSWLLFYNSNMNTAQFQQAISAAGKPVIVDFWAAWCAPCKMTKPVLEKLAQEYAGRVDFLPVDADDSRELLEQYRILGIPTVLALRDGKVAARVTGARSEADYRLLFEGLAAGKEVKVTLAPFDRLIRLGAGGLLSIAGISTSIWWLALAGGILAFLGIYDRCPIWAALTRMLRGNGG